MVTKQTLLHQSYNPSYFALLSHVEERHFWFRTRKRVISTLVSQITEKHNTNYKILDIGCGIGNVTTILKKFCPHGTVVGVDLFLEALQYARHRTSCYLVQADANALPFPNNMFRLICLFDLLEHLPNDTQVLHNLHSILAPDGVLLLTVPAYPSLWSYFDEASHHCRRYTLDDMQKKLISTGYQIEYATYYMAILFPILWVKRRLVPLAQSLFKLRYQADDLAQQELHIIPVINRTLELILAQESYLIARRYRLPIGTSLLVMARK